MNETLLYGQQLHANMYIYIVAYITYFVYMFEIIWNEVFLQNICQGCFVNGSRFFHTMTK